MKINTLLGQLRNVRSSNSGWVACCPAHDDQTASLSIREGTDQKILLKCFAGCETNSIVQALGLGLADLFPNTDCPKITPKKGGADVPPERRATMQPSSGCTLAQYGTAKGLSEKFLQTLGISNLSYSGQPAIRIPYFGPTGEELAVRYRIGLEKSLDDGNHFRWKKGAKPLPYGLWKLKQAQTAGYVVIVEGESDAHTLWLHKISALGLPGAASWKEEWANLLESIPVIYVVIEPDEGGETVKKWIATSIIRDRVRFIQLGKAKDPSGLYLENPSAFLEKWKMTMESAVPWKEFQEETQKSINQEAWETCQALAQTSNILERFAQELAKDGFVGEKKNVQTLYLAVTSRVLGRPINVALKGPSSAGKSYEVEKTLEFFPKDAYYALSAMSERALAYSQEPLQHRMLVLYEAAGIGGEMGTYLIRSLLSEGRVRYEVTEKVDGRFQTRLIEREGPTGLITTTTAIALHSENETRLLSLTVTDTPEQTRGILQSLAVDRDEQPDRSEWQALQGWLATAEHRVVIPFAPKLAENIPPINVRLRRDFSTILTRIKTHAVLHQALRDREPDGRIIASIEDYAVIKDLIADYLAEGAETAVSETVRVTVDTVGTLMDKGKGDVTLTEVAKELQLDKSTILRRVKKAIAGGYLKNLENVKGKPYRLVLGDSLPTNQGLLPDPGTLFPEVGCTVARETTGSLPPSPSMGRERFAL